MKKNAKKPVKKPAPEKKLVKEKPSTPVAKAQVKKPVAKKEQGGEHITRKGRKPGNSFQHLCCSMLLSQKYSDDEIIQALKKEYPDSKGLNQKTITFYRAKLNSGSVGGYDHPLIPMRKLWKDKKGNLVPYRPREEPTQKPVEAPKATQKKPDVKPVVKKVVKPVAKPEVKEPLKKIIPVKKDVAPASTCEEGDQESGTCSGC